MRAFATESRGEVKDEFRGEKTEPNERRILEGVGIVEGILECRAEERSTRTATGDVRGR